MQGKTLTITIISPDFGALIKAITIIAEYLATHPHVHIEMVLTKAEET